jgi:imidazolonepropionase-like amidohydrolase
MLTVFLALLANALAGPVALVGAKIFTVSGEVIESGAILIDEGVIRAIGPVDSVVIPDGADVRDLSGKVIIPGLVDTHSHIANTGDLHEGGMTPEVSAVDGLDISLPNVKRAQAGGITTANVMPGSGTLIGGQTAYLKLRDGVTVDELLYCSDRRTEVCGGMKMANGTNSRGDSGPDSRMGSAHKQREAFLKAHIEAKKRGLLDEETDEDETPKKGKKGKEDEKEHDPDYSLDPMLEILTGKRIVHFHTHRADDIVTAIKLSQEFDFRIVLHHVSEAWKVAEFIAENEIPSSLIVIDSPGGKEEAVEYRSLNGARLEELGALVAFHTDDAITDSRLFLRSGALAVRAGMSRAGALEALTLSGAKMMDLEDRVGSLEVGKDADLVVLSGEPFSIWTKVEQTYVEGERVFDRADPIDRLISVGGEHVSDRYPEDR